VVLEEARGSRVPPFGKIVLPTSSAEWLQAGGYSAYVRSRVPFRAFNLSVFSKLALNL
jgi:hypothetical protein